MLKAEESKKQLQASGHESVVSHNALPSGSRSEASNFSF